MSPIGRRTNNVWFWFWCYCCCCCCWGLVVLVVVWKGRSSTIEVLLLSNEKETFLSHESLHKWQRQLDQSKEQQQQQQQRQGQVSSSSSSSSKSMGRMEFTCPVQTRDEENDKKGNHKKMSPVVVKKRYRRNKKKKKKKKTTSRRQGPQHGRVLNLLLLSNPSRHHRNRFSGGSHSVQRHSRKRTNFRNRTSPRTTTTTNTCLTLDKVANKKGLDILMQALEITGLLNELLDPHNDLTIFAPTDHAFEQLGEHILQELTSTKIDLLAEILLYHVIGCTVTTQRLKSLQATTSLTMPTLLLLDDHHQDDAVETVDLLISRRRGGAIYYVQGDGNKYKRLWDLPRVIHPDIKACNGVLHIVNRVILPDLIMMNKEEKEEKEEKARPLGPASSSSSSSSSSTSSSSSSSSSSLSSSSSSSSLARLLPLGETLVVNGFSSLVQALEDTNLFDTLNDSSDLDDHTTIFTIFAPSNEAIANFLPRTVNHDDLETILLSHMIQGVVLDRTIVAAELTKQPETSFRTMSGARMTLSIMNDTVTIQGEGNDPTMSSPGTVIEFDIRGINGVIHAIDKVLSIVPDLTMMTNKEEEEEEAHSPGPASSSSSSSSLATLLPLGETLDVNGFSSLVEALETTNLFDTLNDSSDLDDYTTIFTIFAPTDEAMADFLPLTSNDDDLETILLSHMIQGVVLDRTIVAAELAERPETSFRTMSGARMTLSIMNDTITIQGEGNDPTVSPPGTVTEFDIRGINGVIHAIDKVLLIRPDLTMMNKEEEETHSPGPSSSSSSLATLLPLGETLVVNGFSSLVEALETTNLFDTLNDSSDLDDHTTIFTIFAPSDTAMADFLPLTSNDDDLETILLSHMIQGVVLDRTIVAAELAERPETSFRTMSGARMTLSVMNDTITIQGEGNDPTVSPPGTVTEFDIRGINGVIHAIDKVLSIVPDLTMMTNKEEEEAHSPGPASLSSSLTTLLPLGETLVVNGFSSLVEALQTTNLFDTLNDSSDLDDHTTIFTIFAPSDKAIADFLPPTSNDDDLGTILLSHMIQGVVLDSTIVAAELTERPETSFRTMSGARMTLSVMNDTVAIQGEGNDPTVSPPGTVIEFDIRGINGVIHAIDKVLLPTLEE